MADLPLIRLTFAHDYYDPAPAPLRLQVAHGMAIRHLGGGPAVILPDRHDMPAMVSVTVLWEALDFCTVTQGYDWAAVPVLAVPPDQDLLAFGDQTALRTERRGPGDRRVLQMDIAIRDGAPRDIRVGFTALAPHWTYHLTGRGLRDDMQIVDPGNEIHFDDLGAETLPNGVPARVLRSAQPMALRARPSRRFALQYEGRFGPVVLVPVLPAAGVKTRPIAEGDAAGRLQADIYVTLS